MLEFVCSTTTFTNEVFASTDWIRSFRGEKMRRQSSPLGTDGHLDRMAMTNWT
jgi:hypothetical protein